MRRVIDDEFEPDHRETEPWRHVRKERAEDHGRIGDQDVDLKYIGVIQRKVRVGLRAERSLEIEELLEPKGGKHVFLGLVEHEQRQVQAQEPLVEVHRRPEPDEEDDERRSEEQRRRLPDAVDGPVIHCRPPCG